MRALTKELKTHGRIKSIQTDSFSYIEVINKYDPRDVLNVPGVGRAEVRRKAHHLYIELESGEIIAIARSSAPKGRFRKKYDYQVFSDRLFNQRYKIGDSVDIYKTSQPLSQKKEIEDIRVR